MALIFLFAIAYLLKYLLILVRAPQVSVYHIGSAPDFVWSFPVLLIVGLAVEKVLTYKRFIDFWSKKKALRATLVIIIFDLFDIYYHYFHFGNERILTGILGILTFVDLIFLVLLVFKKSKQK